MTARWVWPAAVLVIALAGPTVLPAHLLDVGTLAALYVIAGVGLNVLMGLTGQVSFGQGGFWAIGAYGAGTLTVRVGLPVVPAIALSVLGTAVLAVLIGWPVTALRGHYVAIATLALALIVVDVANSWEPVTGGSAGLPGIPGLEVFGQRLGADGFYRLVWLAALGVLLIGHNLARGRPGRAMRAVGADEAGSQALGVPSGAYRLKAFVLAATLAALAGALYATYLGFLSPDAVDVQLSALLLIIVVIGGLGTAYGPLVGAVAIAALTDWLATLGQQPDLPARLPTALNTLAYGAVIVIVMRLFPRGLVPFIQRLGASR